MNSNNTESKLEGRYFAFNDEYFFFSPKNLKTIEPQNYNSRGFILCKGSYMFLNDDTPVKVCIEKTSSFYKDYDGITQRPIYECKDFEIDTSSVDLLYLSGNTFYGIGKKTASLIIEKFGEDLYSKINDPGFIDELCQIKFVTKEKAHKIVENLRNNKKIKEVYEFFYDINPDDCTSLSESLISLYGIEECISKLKKSPYRVGTTIGMDFLSCDSIAAHSFDDKERIAYLLREAIEKNERSGNMYNDIETIMDIAVSIDKRSKREEKLNKKYLLPFFFGNDFISNIQINEQLRCYSPEGIKTEKNIARMLHVMNDNKIKKENINLNEIENCDGFSLSDEQKQAFKALETSGLKIIIGKPGSGKTTVINSILSYISDKHPNSKTVLCAPTGNAAHRMSICTNHKAETIHKTLGLSFDNDIPNKIEADYVIVDEMSMVDTYLFEKLIKSILPETTVILIGDINQIDPVGPGKVLKDLIKIDNIEKYRLETIFRQENTSSIVINSNKINEGKCDLTEDNNFEIIRYKHFNEVIGKIKEVYLDNYDKTDLYNVQILSGIKKRDSGVYNINNLFQNILNKEEKYLIIDKRIFREGDKVIFERNDYEAGYTNGTLGYIDKIENKEIYVKTEDNYIKVTRENIRDLSLAYSTTIHKSQGSEYNTCIIVLSKKCPIMLRRNLLYTAVTRAKKKVYIFSEEDAMEESIRNDTSDERLTSVLDFYYI